ncbi:alcohol dehydrogenase (NADP+) [Sporothrix brasiliensis 5110]|uniref:Alcohol dehydrogenase (NADP+) n=1 Tax=Sporothrix brasiliensis 5110 TaxID=1398154 RepID=A0A0C2IN82_9PEZI|nr:alcohol dehydrogenase (NADP+) [Sporothrix brasiliensis 5110]KIH86487.1 alcohol dehydrogenase (NADP+) [Sporothrix brasiliensis 5110]
MASTKYTLASRVKLADGHTMPQIQLGLFEMSRAEARASVAAGLAEGYRGFDCAQMYDNEREAGQALQDGLARHGLTRADVFYTSKLAENSTSYDTVRASIRQSVAACGLGYIDLFLLHSPLGGPAARWTSWRAVEDAIAAGEVRSGGVSNYGPQHVEELLQHSGLRVAPVVNQIESHPFNTRTDIRDACARHGIVVEAYAPLTRGMRIQHPAVTRLAQQHGCTPAQVLVRWSLQHGMVPLPKSVRRSRMAENADVNGFELSAEDMAALDALDEHLVTDWDPTDAE